MPTPIKGIHHITAVSGPPKENYDFYTKVLGLRFIKKTVNFDDPFTYHLYYGNYEAKPGSAITFFPWQHVVQGSPGAGEATAVHYAIPQGSISFWEARLEALAIPAKGTFSLFGFNGLHLTDNDGMAITLTEDPRIDTLSTKGYCGVPDKHAVRGFFGTTLSLNDTGRTSELMEEFGWKKEGNEDGIERFSSAPANNLGRYVNIKSDPELNGRFGRGSVHHVAFRVPDDQAQAEWRERLVKMGFDVTPVQNRMYFRSIYFREHGGVLFEIATDIPGFTKDEELENLGTELKLPPWYEKRRNEIEKKLAPLEN